jgi:hypothetical protein
MEIGDRVKHISCNKGIGVIIEVGENEWYLVQFEHCTNWFHKSELEKIE